MDEEAAKPRDSTVSQQQQQYYYGTFQGVANYPSPAPPPQFLPPLQHPIATYPGHAYQNVQGPVNYAAQGYPVVPDYTVVEVRPMREHDLPCCGLGMGWFLFVMRFLFGGIPWYLGAFIILVTSVDHREKAGYVACSIASIVYLIAFMLGMTGNVNISDVKTGLPCPFRPCPFKPCPFWARLYPARLYSARLDLVSV